MTRQVKFINLSNEECPILNVSLCESFLCKLRGLMFRKAIHEEEGLVFDLQSDSRINAAIHMFFMRFDITVIWVDSNNSVVDVQLAKRWRPVYVPGKPARFVVETHTRQLNHFKIGDLVRFEIA
jgi:uncharacterized membrane protein (UPF0127 family)